MSTECMTGGGRDAWLVRMVLLYWDMVQAETRSAIVRQEKRMLLKPVRCLPTVRAFGGEVGGGGGSGGGGVPMAADSPELFFLPATRESVADRAELQHMRFARALSLVTTAVKGLSTAECKVSGWVATPQ